MVAFQIRDPQLAASPGTQTPCSGISPAPSGGTGGHFIKLSTALFLGSEVTWPFPTMRTLWRGRSARIKEVINQLTRLLRTIRALHWGGKQWATHSTGKSRAEPSRAEQTVSTLRRLATWNQNNNPAQPLLQQVEILITSSDKYWFNAETKWVQSVQYSKGKANLFYQQFFSLHVHIQLLIFM